MAHCFQPLLSECDCPRIFILFQFFLFMLSDFNKKASSEHEQQQWREKRWHQQKSGPAPG
jgi:hypothetical protein